MTETTSDRPAFDPQMFHPEWFEGFQRHLMEALKLESTVDLLPLFQERRAKPIATDIVKRIAAYYGPEKDIRYRKLGTALGRYTKSFAYCRAMEREEFRYGLNNEPLERVSEDHRTFALQKIEEHKAYRKRRKEQREAAARSGK